MKRELGLWRASALSRIGTLLALFGGTRIITRALMLFKRCRKVKKSIGMIEAHAVIRASW